MSRRRNAPAPKDDVLTPDARLTREWYKFLAEDDWKATDQQAITNATETTVAHKLSDTPSEADAYLVCVTAELGYAIGDRLPLPAFEDASDYGATLFWNATYVGFVVGANGVRIMDRTGGSVGAFAALTNARWRVVMRVRA